MAMSVTVASDGLDGLALDAADLAGITPGEKRKHEVGSGESHKRDVRLRSKAWDHFTKLMKEDGTHEKCKCNHCNKLFSYNSKSGTTHLLRHITEGHCPANRSATKKDKLEASLNYLRGNSEPRSGTVSWKFEDVVMNQQQFNVHDELLQTGLDDLEDGYGGQASARTGGSFPKRKNRPREESWMKELGACVNKLVALTNERLPNSSGLKNCPVSSAPDYSIGNAVRFLNEMEDIPASSEMYLDAFELLRDDGDRECFICLPPEARRKWLQRMLNRRHPLRYVCNF